MEPKDRSNSLMEPENTQSLEELYEQMKTTVRQSFTRLYAALKARELRTLRQLQAARRQCQSSHSQSAASLRSVHIFYDNEMNILSEIENYGQVKLDNLSLNGDPFIAEDYINPEQDHMYSYKDIDDITVQTELLNLDIEEAALRQITSMEDCVCSVHLTADEISKCFRDDDSPKVEMPELLKSNENSSATDESKTQVAEQKPEHNIDESDNTDENARTSDKRSSLDESAKTNPTEEWLNCIKGQIETEPTQVTDVMEHSTIVC